MEKSRLFGILSILSLIGIVYLVYFYYYTPAEVIPMEGFQTATTTPAELPILSVQSISPDVTTGPNKTLSIFDPTAAYVQANIAAIEYPLQAKNVIDTSGKLEGTSGAIRTQILDTYHWWLAAYAQNVYVSITDGIYKFGLYQFSDRYDTTYIEQFQIDYKNRVSSYYSSLLGLFQSHPIGFILSGIESIKTSEYNDYCTNAIKVIDIKNSNKEAGAAGMLPEVPYGYPDPGLFDGKIPKITYRCLGMSSANHV